jgi:hypothetical protein
VDSNGGVKSRLALVLAGLAGFLLGCLVMHLLGERIEVPATVQPRLDPADRPVSSESATRLDTGIERASRHAAGAGSAVAPAVAGKIVYGRTIDEVDAPAPRVALVLECPDDSSLQAVSDGGGAFAFNVPAEGRYKLVAIECPGYIPAEMSVEVPADVSAVRADLRLKRTRSIPVRLLDAQGGDFWNAYKGALFIGPAVVVCTRQPLALQGADSGNALLSSGLARFRSKRELPKQLVYGQRPGFIGLLEPHVDPPYHASLVCCSEVWASIQVNETPEELVFHVDAESKAALGSIRVRFRDERTGEFLQKLDFGVILPGGPRSVSPQVADSQGFFICGRLPAGRLNLLVSEAPLEFLTLTFDAVAGTCVDLGDFTLRQERNESRRGVVLDEKGNPVPDVEVRTEHLDPNGKPSGMFISWTTDSRGSFNYALHASGGLLHVHDAEWVSAPLRLEYSAPVDVPIEIRASRGSPCHLAATGSIEESWGVLLRDAQGLVAFEGSVRGGSETACKLAPGRYELSVMTPEGTVSKQPLELGAGGARVELPR